MHMSISSPIGSLKEIYEPFYAGILKHLRAIAAFTYSSMVSYDRVVDGCWAGGTWVAWGTQNREVPLRKVDGSHWEIKCIDGIANSYLSLAAIILAGVQGVADNETLTLRDCTKDPALLSASEREDLNMSARLPRSIQEALEALHQDEELTGLIGSEVVKRYTEIKQAETAILEKLGDEERAQWIMERY
jgi:glutamine synthetase